MKTMTCKQLGGPCYTKFQAETFEKMADLSRKHGIEMFRKGDAAHIRAMDAMKQLMMDPAAMKKWLEARKKIFNALPDE
ncbi:MAG: DUF1059 domain-containing protein [Ignavibacteria bacterium]|nr:DUF1059 domain-containing protein [Ignavibacteria bacterium]